MDEVTKAEIERLHDEEKRQNRRIEILEQNVTAQQNMALSIQRMATTMEGMLKEQQEQGDRLTSLEQEPAKSWSNMKKTIFNTIVGAGAGAVAVGLFSMIAQYIK